MKPLPVAPLTPLDDRIMQGIRARWRYPLNHWYQFYDREDATLMLRLQSLWVQGTCYLRIGAGNYAVPAVQVYVRKDPMWPT